MIEPNPSLFAKLPEIPGATKFPYAVSGDAGSLSLTIDPADDKASTVMRTNEPSSGAEAIEVEGRRLSQVVEEAGVDRIDIVKLDIEGAEVGVLLSEDGSFLQRIDQITCEFHDGSMTGGTVTSEEVRKAIARLNSLGFQTFVQSRPINGHGDVLFVNKKHRRLNPFNRFRIQIVEYAQRRLNDKRLAREGAKRGREA
jgi:FkbM family methyltransferase